MILFYSENMSYISNSDVNDGIPDSIGTYLLKLTVCEHRTVRMQQRVRLEDEYRLLW